MPSSSTGNSSKLYSSVSTCWKTGENVGGGPPSAAARSSSLKQSSSMVSSTSTWSSSFLMKRCRSGPYCRPTFLISIRASLGECVAPASARSLASAKKARQRPLAQSAKVLLKLYLSPLISSVTSSSLMLHCTARMKVSWTSLMKSSPRSSSSSSSSLLPPPPPASSPSSSSPRSSSTASCSKPASCSSRGGVTRESRSRLARSCSSRGSQQ
mmetsp:Transcript_6093/g.22355  ORF Transcript_6093/g.22355 Transcript_6093/m.22355 type:complete len:212 (+) Transcript_6093:529-1164(+)